MLDTHNVNICFIVILSLYALYAYCSIRADLRKPAGIPGFRVSCKRRRHELSPDLWFSQRLARSSRPIRPSSADSVPASPPPSLLEMTLSNRMAHDPVHPVSVESEGWMNGQPRERDNQRVCAIHHEGRVGMTVDLHLVSFERRIHRLSRQRATTPDPDLMTLIFEFAHPSAYPPPRPRASSAKTRGSAGRGQDRILVTPSLAFQGHSAASRTVALSVARSAKRISTRARR
jgi:hypothetical protein